MQEFLTANVPAEVLDLAKNPTVQLTALVTALVFVLGACRIVARTGHSVALGLLMFVPVVNLFVFLYLAFGPWPTERELRALRKTQTAAMRTEKRLDKLAA